MANSASTLSIVQMRQLAKVAKAENVLTRYRHMPDGGFQLEFDPNVTASNDDNSPNSWSSINGTN